MLKFKMKSWLIALVILLGIEKPLMADPVLCGNTYCAGECLAILRLTLEAEDPAHLCNRVQCELIVDFVQVGLFDNGTTSVPGTHTGYSIFAQGIGKIQGCTELAYDNFITALPPIDSQNSCFLPAHSSINVDSRSLLETIPLVGPPFNLNYTSERFRTGFKYQPKTLGLGGWEPSIVHHYDKVNKVVYFGDGGAYPVEAVQTNDGYYATNPSGSEVYYFNTDGVHQQTKNSLTGFIEWQFNYSPTGQILSISDRFNNTTSFVYSSSGISITSPFGQVSTLILDASGFLKSVRNPNNEVYELTNNASGFLINFQKPGGQKSTVTYDSGGFVLKDLGTGGDFISLLQNFNSSTGEQTITSSTALDRKTSYVTTADSNGSTHSITHPFGQYSTSNTPTEGAGNSSNSLGHQGSYVLTSDPRFGSLAPYKQISNFSIANSNINLSVVTNKSAQLSNVNDPLSLTSLLTTVTVQNDASRTFSSSYTAANKLVTNTSAVNRVTYQQLNDLGLLSSVQVGPLVPVLFSYDDRGRLIQVNQSGRTFSFTYDSRGNVASSIDSLGRTTHFSYDNANRITERVLPSGEIIATTYDANGNLTSLTPPNKPRHDFTYNLMELVASYLPPSLSSQVSSQTTYEYNLDQQLTQVHRPDGSQIAFNYDANHGLLNSINSPNGNFVISYVPNTNLIASVTSPDNEVTSYQYFGDILKSVTTNGLVSSQVAYAYYPDASLASITIGSSSTTLSYDKDGLLIKAGELALTRNNFGAVSTSTLGKVAGSMTYNQFGEMASQSFSDGKKVLFSREYIRDNLGRVIRHQESAKDKKPQNYEYDSLGRLTKAYIGNDIREYRYDENGNRIAKKEDKKEVLSKYDVQDRLTNFGEFEYQYNANGELIKKIEHKYDFNHKKFNTKNDRLEIITYEYDSFGNLKKVTLPKNKVVEYILDGQHRRIGKKLNGVLKEAYVYQSQTQIAAVLLPTGVILKQFIYGEKSNIPDYVIEKGKTYRIISNQIGSPELLVEVTKGKIEEEFAFDEFGIPDNHNDDKSILPFGFAGGLYDQDTKLFHFGARDYDPEVGRWTSKDPIGFAGGDTNLFGYVANDPVNFVDPSGLSSIVYNRSNGTITLIDRNGNTVGTYPAANNTTSASGGPWPNGTYPYSHYVPHPESGPTGPFGSNGNSVFTVPGRTGMGVHSGRSGPQSNTEGCVRTNDDATSAIRNLNATDPLTSITIGN